MLGGLALPHPFPYPALAALLSISFPLLSFLLSPHPRSFLYFPFPISPPYRPFPFLFPFLFPFVFFPLPSLRSKPFKSSHKRSGERCKLPQRDVGAEPQPKSNLVHFSQVKMWHLVATIGMIFLRINWPNFVQFTQ